MRFDQIAPPKVSMANNTCYQQIVSKQVLKIYKNEIWRLDSFLFTQNNLRNSAQKLLGISKINANNKQPANMSILQKHNNFHHTTI